MNKVLVALSGGVDSAVCAYLLRKQGFDVECAMMRLHDGINMKAEIKAASDIAKALNLRFHELDYRDEFSNHVIDYFTSTYILGKTPNPCIECNRHMKFAMFMQAAKKLNCDKIATGHYAKIQCIDKKEYNLLRAIDTTKDQSYVLYFLNQKQLSKIIFPLGTMHKRDIRKIAAEIDLPCANKPESQDICFVEKGNYAKYVITHANYVPVPGNITDSHGNIVGTHKGLINYTIGQRKGIDIAFGEPMYVSKIDTKTNTLVMASRQKCMRDTLELEQVNWVAGTPPKQSFEATIKLRYRQSDKPCTVYCDYKDSIHSNDNKIDKIMNHDNENSNNKKNTKYKTHKNYKTCTNTKIILHQPQDGITPGQFGVIYDGEKVLGGGVIK